jgi:hypothetical protein
VPRQTIPITTFTLCDAEPGSDATTYGPGRRQTGCRQPCRAAHTRRCWRLAGSRTSISTATRTPCAGWRTVRFSDNYLDLRDGELAEIAVRGLTDDIGEDQLRAISGLTR